MIFSQLSGLDLRLFRLVALPAFVICGSNGRTVENEPTEIYPFLGSSRLEDPIDRYRCTAVFHGHAHRGSLEGRTKSGIPVYNVAMPLLLAHFPDQPPLRIIEVPVDVPALA